MNQLRRPLKGVAVSAAICFASPAFAQDEYNCEVTDPIVQEGAASFYGRQFHGNPTASGEIFNMHANTAASNTLEMGTIVEVTNLNNGESVIVKTNDTGNFGHSKYNTRHGQRVIDLSRGAAEKIEMISGGVIPVEIRVCKELSDFALNESSRPERKPAEFKRYKYNIFMPVKII